LILTVVATVCIFGAGICITLEPVGISSRFTRMLQSGHCTSGSDPCHVYLTWTENPSTSVIVNFHTKDQVSDPRVNYDILSHSNQPLTSYNFSIVGDNYLYESVDISRGINWVVLHSLQPDTVYYFRAGSGSDGSAFSKEFAFRTAPSEGDFSFVTGGDMNTGDDAKNLMKVAGKQDPLFAMVGGDIAYANAMETCYRQWDYWLDNWQDLMYTTQKYYIPMVFGLGNHEAGGFGMSLDDVPFAVEWFPQSARADQDSRKSYHSHSISNNTMLLVLDSGISSPVDGDQLEWMQGVVSSPSQYQNKMAVYHVPLYPSWRSYDYKYSVDVRDSWGPFFDQNHWSVNFENHDHAYKRSYLLKNNEVVTANGTLYLGDGAWGVHVRDGMDRWYIAQHYDKLHIFRVVVQNGGLNITALDDTGNLFDSAFQPYF